MQSRMLQGADQPQGPRPVTGPQPQQDPHAAAPQQDPAAPPAAAAPSATPSAPAPGAAAVAVAAAAAAPAAAAPAPPPAGGQPGRLLYLIVTQGAEAPERRPHDGGRPAGARYTRDSVRCLLQLLGCKPRLAHKISALVFSSVEALAAPPAPGAGGRQQRTSRRQIAVHAHGRDGRVAVSLPRGEFMQLVSAAAAQFQYKIAPTSDELKVATG